MKEQIKKVKIEELIPDSSNFNKGTEFGNSLIEKSLRFLGAGRSILLDKNNNIIGGNKTTENAAAIGIENVLVIETDGTQLVAVKRTDLDINSKEGREMALADNATSKANLEWDYTQIGEHFNVEEQESWGIFAPILDEDAEGEEVTGKKEYQIIVTLNSEQEQDQALKFLQSNGYDARAFE